MKAFGSCSQGQSSWFRAATQQMQLSRVVLSPCKSLWTLMFSQQPFAEIDESQPSSYDDSPFCPLSTNLAGKWFFLLCRRAWMASIIYWLGSSGRHLSHQDVEQEEKNHGCWEPNGVATFSGHAQLLPWLTLSNNHTRDLNSRRLPRSHLFPLHCQCSSWKILEIPTTDFIALMFFMSTRFQLYSLPFSTANAQIIHL